MSGNDSQQDDYGAAYIIEFDDGSYEGQILHRGPRDACDQFIDTPPAAIAYGGPKRIKGARVIVMPWMDIESMFGGVAQ